MFSQRLRWRHQRRKRRWFSQLLEEQSEERERGACACTDLLKQMEPWLHLTSRNVKSFIARNMRGSYSGLEREDESEGVGSLEIVADRRSVSREPVLFLL